MTNTSWPGATAVTWVTPGPGWWPWPQVIISQSELSIQVTWPVLTNQSSVSVSRDLYWPIRAQYSQCWLITGQAEPYHKHTTPMFYYILQVRWRLIIFTFIIIIMILFNRVIRLLRSMESRTEPRSGSASLFQGKQHKVLEIWSQSGRL